MSAPAILGLIAAVLLVATLVILVVDFTLWSRTRAREAREFAFRRHLRPNHMVHDSLGDPITCRDTSHNHNPQDFTERFRVTMPAKARALAVILTLSAALILGAIGTGLALADLVQGSIG